jgi:hypothetical protein
VASCPILGRGYAQQEVIHAPNQRLTDLRSRGVNALTSFLAGHLRMRGLAASLNRGAELPAVVGLPHTPANSSRGIALGNFVTTCLIVLVGDYASIRFLKIRVTGHLLGTRT